MFGNTGPECEWWVEAEVKYGECDNQGQKNGST